MPRELSFEQFQAERGVATPEVDHSELSPSGRRSKREERARIQRLDARFGAWFALLGEYTRLLGTGELVDPSGRHQAKAAEETRSRAGHCRHLASQLRELARAGMRPRVHEREAARLDAEADELDQKALALDAEAARRKVPVAPRAGLEAIAAGHDDNASTHAARRALAARAAAKAAT